MANLARVNNPGIERQNRNISRANVLEDILAIPTQNIFGNVSTRDCGMVQNNIVNNVYSLPDEEYAPHEQYLPPPIYESPPARDGLKRTLIGVSIVAMIVGTIATLSVLSFFGWLIYTGLSRAHMG